MAQLEHIEAIERRLWSAADTLRANSRFASNEYFLPVMGLVFLRHAYSRYLAVRPEVEAALPTRDGRRRRAGKEDFSRRSAIFLRPEAQFDHLVALPDGSDRAAAIIRAMESIQKDYESLRGALPKEEYRKLTNDVLGDLLRTLNPEELKRVSGDVFGRIYEYFLTQFADQKAHDNGEFFTPVSLVSFIAHTLEPDRGVVLDPASGSGGMFVQSARTVTERGGNPTERLTFRGIEKNDTTIRLARMNLAVHGLEGDIRQAITYYEDPHELLGKADYVMANPPFNVDEIDAEKVKRDPRLPFGLPGVNKKDKVSNGNYVWISYFYSYLNPRGRAGFVMSSQASSASGAEAAVRRKLVETGDVELMVAIRSNFFYTRTVPCELWFLDRARPPDRRDTVLMLDARSVFRKVTRKIYDFTPEQQQNLLAVVWLYRGETERFRGLVSAYLQRALQEAEACQAPADDGSALAGPLPVFASAVERLRRGLEPFLNAHAGNSPLAAARAACDEGVAKYRAELGRWEAAVREGRERRDAAPPDATRSMVEDALPLAERSLELVRWATRAHRVSSELVKAAEAAKGDGADEYWKGKEVHQARKQCDEAKRQAEKQLDRVRYFWRQARWLTDRFPDGVFRDVEGFVKAADRSEIEANDWSLTPGRYVGVAPEDPDEDFDFRASLREIHDELATLNAEAARLAATIQNNLSELTL